MKTTALVARICPIALLLSVIIAAEGAPAVEKGSAPAVAFVDVGRIHSLPLSAGEVGAATEMLSVRSPQNVVKAVAVSVVSKPYTYL